jgi:phenol 2-monooxygenase
MPSTGRYNILVLASNDLLDKSGASQSAILSSIDTIQKFPPGVINLFILHPLKERFEWTDVPPAVKTFAEMRTYGLARKEDAYEIFGISKDRGVIAVVRPDGYVGVLAPLTGGERVEAFFHGCLKPSI